MKRLKDDNKGLSLVELIVVVLITGILMTAVGFFISFSRVTYQDVATSARLQEEALTVDKLLSEMFMESEAWDIKSVSVNATKGSLAGQSVACDVLWIIARDNESNTLEKKCYYFILEKPTGILRYCTTAADKVTPSSNTLSDDALTAIKAAVGDQYKMVAQNVVSFTRLSENVTGGTKTAFLNFKFNFLGEDFTSNISAQSRNIN